MPAFNDAFLLWTAIAIQIAGAVSVVGIRLTERSWARGLCQRAFFICLLAVGLATMSAIYLDKGSWLPCAATLGLMAVGATLDCSSTRRSPAYNTARG
jgi:hypothetical protein